MLKNICFLVLSTICLVFSYSCKNSINSRILKKSYFEYDTLVKYALISYDEKGNIINLKYFNDKDEEIGYEEFIIGTNGQISENRIVSYTDSSKLYKFESLYKYSYDTNNRESKREYFFTSTDTTAKRFWVKEYSTDGLLTTVKDTLLPFDTKYYIYEYNTQNKLVKVSVYFDPDLTDVNYISVFEYTNGMVNSILFYNDSIISDSNLYKKRIYIYDSNNYLSKIETHVIEDDIITIETLITYERDDDGNIIKEIYSDGDGYATYEYEEGRSKNLKTVYFQHYNYQIDTDYEWLEGLVWPY